MTKNPECDICGTEVEDLIKHYQYELTKEMEADKENWVIQCGIPMYKGPPPKHNISKFYKLPDWLGILND